MDSDNLVPISTKKVFILSAMSFAFDISCPSTMNDLGGLMSCLFLLITCRTIIHVSLMLYLEIFNAAV